MMGEGELEHVNRLLFGAEYGRASTEITQVCRLRGSDFLTAENRQSNKVHTRVYTSVSLSRQAVKHGSPSLIAQNTAHPRWRSAPRSTRCPDADSLVSWTKMTSTSHDVTSSMCRRSDVVLTMAVRSGPGWGWTSPLSSVFCPAASRARYTLSAPHPPVQVGAGACPDRTPA